MVLNLPQFWQGGATLLSQCFGRRAGGFNSKLVLSETLGEKGIDCLCSETVTLDL